MNGRTIVVFPLTPNVANPPQAGGTRLLINREIIGQGRRSRNDYHEAMPYETVALDYLCDNAEAWHNLIAFFSERTDWQAFWLPVPLQLTRLAKDTDGSNQITLLDTSEIQAGDSIALWDSNGHVVRRVHSKTGKTLTLENPVGIHTTDETMISAAILARLVKRRLKLTWTTDAMAETSLEFRELPPEAIEPAPEPSESLGALPTLASLYTFTQRPSFNALLEDSQVAEANEGTISRFTSYEHDLSTATLSWQAISITHSEVKRGIDLQDECTLEAELRDNRQVVFAGEIRQLKSRGTKAIVSCGIPRVFDAILPRARFAPVCQWALFSVPCGLVSSDWIFQARVTDVGIPGYPFTFVVDTIARLNGEPLPASFGTANWFAWGSLKSDNDTIAIRQSTAIENGAITLTLARDPNPMLSIGETVQLFPGCDGLPETCQDKFDNFLNWGGARVAAANLSLIKVNLPGNDSGGKK